MKRLFCVMMAILMLCGTLAMTACTETAQSTETTTAETTTAETTTAETTTAETTTAETTTAETTTEETTTEEKPVIESWAIFDYNGVIFTYPASWQKMEGEASIVVDALTGDNITVVCDATGYDYTALTKEAYEAVLIPQIEAMGMTVTSFSLEQVKNKIGTKLTVVAYTASAADSESEFNQTQYIAKAGSVNQIVTVTSDDEVLLDAVFNSLSVEDISVSAENKVYDNRVIAFEYPGTWIESDSEGTVILTDSSGNNITVASEAKTDYYQTMTIDDFNRDIAPSLTSMGMTVSGASVEQTVNANGVSLTVIVYDISYMGISMSQTLFVTSVGSDTYAVTVTEVTENTGLPETVFDTLRVTFNGN